MTIQETVDLLWQSTQKWESPAAALQKTLTFAEAYRVQLGILARWQAAGENLGGWKIGASAEGARKALGLAAPISGYLLASRHFSSDHAFTHAALRRPIIESELCFTIGSRLAGSGRHQRTCPCRCHRRRSRVRGRRHAPGYACRYAVGYR